jgi:hypothetical protein
MSLPTGYAGCGKFFDELNNLGWDLQLQAQEVEREAHKLRELKNRLEFYL